jgi:alkylation response protein AidB-like acyl-CoA dehydrogenase
MDDHKKKFIGGGMFITNDISFQEVFTPEDFSPEHHDIANAAEDFIKGEITSLGEEIEILNNELSRNLIKKAGDLGFLGIDIPEKYGGMGLDMISSAIVSEKFGYGAGSFAVTELNHSGIGTLPVALFGTEEQKKKYLPALCSGKLIGAFALTEPEAGSDALNPLTTATLTEDGKHYLLNGNKQFITNAGFADIIFTYAKVDGKYFTAFIVERNWDGVSVDEEEEKMGMHGTSTRSIHFDNVKVPIENVLGEVGKGHAVALNALNMGRFKVGALCIGNAKAAFCEAVKYAKQRKQFRKPICEFGLIKEKISEMAIRLFAAESMLYRTAGLLHTKLEGLDKNSDDFGIRTAEALEEYLIECSINKIFGSETEAYVVDEEVQIFGGYGYIHGYHPELAYRNARINRIWEGTNEINRIVIANTLLKRLTQDKLGISLDFQFLLKEIEKLEPVNLEESYGLISEKKIIDIIKRIGLFVIGMAYDTFRNRLRDEQELIGMISNIVIEIYALESALLRSEKILNSKKFEKAEIPIKMTKILFRTLVERIKFLATEVMEAVETGELLIKYLEKFRKLICLPPVNTVALRRDIAEAMIQYGRYFL